MVPIILADDLLAAHLPQPGVVVRAGRHQVCRVGAERAVPYPALMSREGGLQREGLWLLLRAGFRVADLPYLGGVVRTAGGQLLDVGGEQDPGDVFLVRAEMCHREELGSVE